jgi:hypothetical protein
MFSIDISTFPSTFSFSHERFTSAPFPTFRPATCLAPQSFIHPHTLWWPIAVTARLRRRSVAAHLHKSWVVILPGAWSECCVLLGRGLCDELLTRPEEFRKLWCIVVCDLET